MAKELVERRAKIEQQIADLSSKRERIQQKSRELHTELNELILEEKAAQLAEGLTEEQRDALAKAISIAPTGIAPQEAVGEPGK